MNISEPTFNDKCNLVLTEAFYETPIFYDWLKEIIAQAKSNQVQAAVKPACEQYQLLIDALVNILNEDGHQWSTRPCPTCRVITAVIGKPFGCDKRRLSKSV
jgi:hypothetical protein